MREKPFLSFAVCLVAIFVVSLVHPACLTKAAEPIVIGVLTALGSIDGADAWRSVQMAVEKINAKGGVTVGGIKRPLKAYSIDTREHEPGIPVHDAFGWWIEMWNMVKVLTTFGQEATYA